MVSTPIGHFWSRSRTETRRTNTIRPLFLTTVLSAFFPLSIFLTVKVNIHWKRLLVFLSLEDKTKNRSISKECQGRRKKLEHCLGGTFFLGKSTRACFLFLFFLFHSSKLLNIWLVLWMISLLYCEIFIRIHVHSSGWSCSLFFPLTLVLIEVKKQFHSSSAAVFSFFWILFGLQRRQWRVLFQYFEVTLFTVLCF